MTEPAPSPQIDDSLLPADIVALAARVVAENHAAGRTIALAESCTGGLVAAALTEIAGSSAVLDRAFVTYADAAKREMLGVPQHILDSFGAVSTACAYAMAEGALAHSGADIAVSVSGVAGPGGGSATKPVGFVTFARALRGDAHVHVEERRLDPASRSTVRHQAALIALGLLLP